MQNSLYVLFAVIFIGMVGSSAHAQDVTATCKDGTTFTGTSNRGACSRHGGVQTYGTPAVAAAPQTPAATSGTAAAQPSTGPASTSSVPVLSQQQ